MKVVRTLLSALIGVPIALLYGLLVRITFGAEETSNLLATMTCSFLFLVPMAIGALTVWFAPPELKTSPLYAIVMPWMSISIVATASLVIALEAAICIIMALPIFLFLSSIGGYIVFSIESKHPNYKASQNKLMGIILLAPYLSTPLEMRLPINEVERTVESKIRIDAPANTVWDNIIDIPAILPNEQVDSIFHHFGIPKLTHTMPLTTEDVGGTRIIVFDNGLAFKEVVTTWHENVSIGFAISPSDQSNAPAPFSMIGKQYFAVTEMNYWIMQEDDDTVILHITSKHRLSTRFNSYAGFWTDLMLDSLQSYVLRRIEIRSESQSS